MHPNMKPRTSVIYSSTKLSISSRFSLRNASIDCSRYATINLNSQVAALEGENEALKKAFAKAKHSQFAIHDHSAERMRRDFAREKQDILT